MELCTGGEFFAAVTETGIAFTEMEAAVQFSKLFKAMFHCHSQNIIHRDIKPENIMYGEENKIKLIDFGFAIISKRRKAHLDVAGTPYYMAPEVIDNNYGTPCDIWSLGVVLY